MSDANRFFEYPARWQQLYEAFRGGNEEQLRQAVAQLEERDIALEDHLRNRPSGGGCTEIVPWYSGWIEGLTGNGTVNFGGPSVTLTEERVVRVTFEASWFQVDPGMSRFAIFITPRINSAYQADWTAETASELDNGEEWTGVRHHLQTSMTQTLSAGTYEFTADVHTNQLIPSTMRWELYYARIDAIVGCAPPT